MNFNPYYSEISDESLFLQMAGGDKMASGILFKRYEYLGKQMAGVFIRKECLRDKTDLDYYEAIHDSINKAFRYYQIGQGRFYVFCRNLLEQNLIQETKKFALEKEKQKELVSLDSPLGGDKTLSYHDVIGDSRQLTMSEHCDVNNVLEILSSLNDEYAKEVYVLYTQGVSLREIAKELNISYYRVHEIVKNISSHLSSFNLRLR